MLWSFQTPYTGWIKWKWIMWKVEFRICKHRIAYRNAKFYKEDGRNIWGGEEDRNSIGYGIYAAEHRARIMDINYY